MGPRRPSGSGAALLALVFAASPARPDAPPPPGRADRAALLRGTRGTYDGEPRTRDGRVDAARLVGELGALGANAYNFLIWHAATDWDDLARFLPLARARGIRVWVTLVPPSESPPHADRYSEPFRLDYARWAREIAALGLREPNLVAWSIDDFTHNLRFFTPARLRGILEGARAVNPRLAFVPCAYFSHVTADVARRYGGLVDGILFPYRHESAGANLTDAGLCAEEIGKLRRILGPDLPIILDIYASAHSRLGATTPAYVRDALAAGRRAADGVMIYCHQAPESAKGRIIGRSFRAWSRGARRIAPVPFTAVRLTDTFWAPRIARNREVTIPHCLARCEATGRIRNLERAGRGERGGYEGAHFNDSDVFKVIEGAAYAIAGESPPGPLARRIDRLVATIARAQRPDGYLNSYFTLTAPEERWRHIHDPARHELYCAGHLIEAGVAHFEATGSRALLDVARRLADHIDRVFGPGKRGDVPEHQEIELALVRLYRATGKARYLRLARFFVQARGDPRTHALYGPYSQDHLPVRESREAVGHAVRAMYGACAMADLAAETGDAPLLEACRRIWESATTRRMYVTGGVGARRKGEAFGADHELPNETAYAETCAAIGLAFFAHRMLGLEADGRHADVLERVLYNGILSGVSLDGRRFFYVNPLASRGTHHRKPWFGCACCPTNVARFLPRIGGYLYGVAEDGIYIHLYVRGRAAIPFREGRVVLVQETRYPWDGAVRITVEPGSPARFALYLRIPGWCEGPRLEVDGRAVERPDRRRGYVRLERRWTRGDRIALDLPMPARRIEAHPRVEADAGRVALARGPIVYCVEAVDAGGRVRNLSLPRSAPLLAEHCPDLLGGVTVIRSVARARFTAPWGDALYRPLEASPLETVPLLAVPYFAWDHRAPGAMAVWLPESPALAEPAPLNRKRAVHELRYPPPPRADAADTLHGVRVRDPYRPLEDLDAPATRAWIAAQNEVAASFLAVPARARIRARLERLWDHERFGLPRKEGGRYFFTRNEGLQPQGVLYVADAPRGKPRVLLDPNPLSEDGTVALAGWSPSPDGRLLAYGLSEAGSDWQTWRVREVETGEDLPDRIPWVKFSGASWRRDGEGFFYCRYDPPPAGARLSARNECQKLCYHRIGTPPSEDVLVYERRDHPDWGFSPEVTDDGRYLIVSVWHAADMQSAIFYEDLADPGGPMVELLPEWDASYAFVGNDGPIFWIRTDRDAPRGRVLAIDTRDPAPEEWREVIPEGEDVLQSADRVGGRLAVRYLRDACSGVRIFAPDGTLVREVALPGIGTATGFRGRADDPETFYAFTSFIAPPAIRRYDVRTGRSELLRRPSIPFDPDRYETRQVFCRSADGTRVPLFITSRKGIRRDGRNPTYLVGYGGFRIPLTPRFSPSRLVWLEMGGVLAVPNLRGGGEYGEAWHRAGMGAKKQNVFDDAIAAAEYLIAAGYTTPSRLAIGGGSNGGLLVGACLTQRPELFAAAVPSVGVFDMLRFHRFTIGWAWTGEFGSPEDPEAFRWLWAYSPLHNVRPGTAYPATLIMTSDHDDRVVPAHSYKFAAALQAAQAGGAPILLRVGSRAGHGAGKPTAKAIDEAADRWTFLARVLDIAIPADFPRDR